ncbi:von Willebrand factor type A domain-containing protein [Daejeonella rubra]|uniref:von Willebrand factor type A domain-containing protein n=1 Tax=Daejeonella rubra TaxID=990371 RepID=A0A1G9YCS0_9SPHI|nr:vWA domain-containing protein [Daejeonella rubra]SDN06426.1 von Willebrand factor type A domain-containing protein [Daejeonella rubra]
MNKETSTEIICILDKSGSMEILQAETISGLNQFIEEQKLEPGLCNFSLVQFNQGLETTILRQAIQQVGKLTSKSYQPNGYTALLDAVGLTLKTAMETHFMLPANQAPDKVLVFIITDGQENASLKYNRAQVSALISQLQTNKGWEFQFFGANIDSFGEAQGIGIAMEQADNWDYSKDGLNVMMKKMGDRAKDVRSK